MVQPSLPMRVWRFFGNCRRFGNYRKDLPHMTLADERLRELDNPSLTADESTMLRSEVAAALIHKGQYEDAREALGELWRGVGERPDVKGLAQRTAAELLLQAGVLSGWLGASKQGVGVQAAAKDL